MLRVGLYVANRREEGNRSFPISFIASFMQITSLDAYLYAGDTKRVSKRTFLIDGMIYSEQQAWKYIEFHKKLLSDIW